MALLFPAAALDAQSCRGLPEMPRTRINVGTEGSATGGARALSGIAGFATSHTFGDLRFGGQGSTYDNLHRRTIGGVVGLGARMGESAIFVCPVAAYRHVAAIRGAPNDYASAEASLGLAVGRAFAIQRFALTPFAQVDVIRSTASFRSVSFQVVEDSVMPLFGDRRQAVTWLGQLAVGTGVRLNNRFTVAPSMGVPLERSGLPYGRDFTVGITGMLTLPR